MADEHMIVRNADGSVMVILHPACGVSREAILELLLEAGVKASAVTFIEPAQAQDVEAGEGPDCIIIPVDQSVSDAPELDEATRRCSQGGGSVVVVFGEGFSPTGLHPIAEKYGTQCGWSARELAPRISGSPHDGGPLDASGKSVSRSTTSQVKC